MRVNDMKTEIEIERLKYRIYLLELVILKLANPFEEEDPVELARIAVRCYNIPIHGLEDHANERMLN